MKKNITTICGAVFFVLLSTALETFYLNHSQIFAKEANQPSPEIKTFGPYISTSGSPNPYPEVDAAIEAKDYAELDRIFKKLKNKPNLTINDQLYLHQLHGYSCIDLGKLNCAINELKKLIAQPKDVPETLYNQTLYIIAQLYFSLENYSEALNYGKRWFNTQTEPNSRAYLLISQAYYMLEDYEKALPYALNGIQLSRDQGNIPKEGVLNLLHYIYRKSDKHEKAIPVLNELIEHYPNKAYQKLKNETLNKLSQ